LCPRVLLIDHGRLHFDGALAALVEQVAPHKRLSAVFAEPITREAAALALDGLSTQVADDPLRISLTVPRDQVADVAARLLRTGRVVDLSIEEVSVEEIIRGIFSRPAGVGERR
jgi:ABC-2 type transport system ATP-binding protein